ncbi:MAG: hypothetical protein Solumvirus3_16 [Solumvirus sp.]|uniref:Thioredoxin domain-containing protein n=1 Tax=Solumvirus sp. TaxID=2487773 RepID=A0A3G5AGP7_9VIRU|nr:MAG: hypothetical protein Solumvirus3_16 [Solumvirus sp.]
MSSVNNYTFSKPTKTVVAVLSESCGACRSYKPEWIKIKSDLGKTFGGDLQIVDVDLKTMSLGELKEKSPRLLGIIDHYPTILIMPSSVWNNDKLLTKDDVTEPDSRSFDNIKKALDALGSLSGASSSTNSVLLPTTSAYLTVIPKNTHW